MRRYLVLFYLQQVKCSSESSQLTDFSLLSLGLLLKLHSEASVRRVLNPLAGGEIAPPYMLHTFILLLCQLLHHQYIQENQIHWQMNMLNWFASDHEEFLSFSILLGSPRTVQALIRCFFSQAQLKSA